MDQVHNPVWFSGWLPAVRQSEDFPSCSLRTTANIVGCGNLKISQAVVFRLQPTEGCNPSPWRSAILTPYALDLSLSLLPAPLTTNALNHQPLTTNHQPLTTNPGKALLLAQKLFHGNLERCKLPAEAVAGFFNGVGRYPKHRGDTQGIQAKLHQQDKTGFRRGQAWKTGV